MGQPADCSGQTNDEIDAEVKSLVDRSVQVTTSADCVIVRRKGLPPRSFTLQQPAPCVLPVHVCRIEHRYCLQKGLCEGFQSGLSILASCCLQALIMPLCVLLPSPMYQRQPIGDVV